MMMRCSPRQFLLLFWVVKHKCHNDCWDYKSNWANFKSSQRLILERGKPDCHWNNLLVLSTQSTKSTHIQRNFGVRFIVRAVRVLTTHRKSKIDKRITTLCDSDGEVSLDRKKSSRKCNRILASQFCPVLTPLTTPIFDFHELVSAQEYVSN